MRIILLLIQFSFFTWCFANDSSIHFIRLNFLYGSKPAKEYKGIEPKKFGGIKGGHVNIAAGDKVLDFMPVVILYFQKIKNHQVDSGKQFNILDTTNTKWTTYLFLYRPINFHKLQLLFDSLAKQTPYDYAIFGMRCAAASYDVLSMIGLFPESQTRKYCYPFLP
jgi:hypothetical protein